MSSSDFSSDVSPSSDNPTADPTDTDHSSDQDSHCVGIDYRRFTSPGFDGASRWMTVIVHHATDHTIVSGLETMRVLSGDGYIKPMLVASASGSGIDGRFLLDGESLDHDLLDALHRAGTIHRLDIVSVFSNDLLDEANLGELAASAADLVQICRRLAPQNTAVRDHHIAFPEYGSLPQVGFGGASDTRIIVVPEDRRFPSAMARPLDRSDPEAFNLHIAVEMASLCGLWETMDDNPLERIRSAFSGTDVPLVVLARSLVRLAQLSCPSPTSIIQQGRNLQVPAGARRTPVPAEMAVTAASLLFPEEFRLPPLDGPADADSAGSTFWRGMGRRLIRDLRRFPQRLRDTASHGVSTALDEMASALRSETPWLVKLWDGQDTSEPRYREVCDHFPGPIEVSTPEIWDRLVRSTLGVADQAECADQIRRAASGDDKQVLASKRCLVSAPEMLEEIEDVYRSLAGCAEQSAGTHSNDPPSFSNDEDKKAPTPGDGANSGTSDSDTDACNSTAATLLNMITSEFARQKNQAQKRVDECHSKLRDLGPEWQDKLRPTAEMSQVVPFCLAFGVLLVLLTWGVLFSPFNDFLNIDNLATNSDTRARIWIVPTFLMGLLLLAVNMPRETRKQQWYLILGTTGFLGSSVTLLVWPSAVGSLVTSDFSDSPVRIWTLIIVILIIMAISVSTMIGWGTNSSSSARLSATLVLVYLTLGTVILLNDSDSRPPVLDDNGTELLIVFTSISVALIFVSFAVVTVVHYRHGLKLHEWHDEVSRLADLHENVHRQADVLASVYPHWLGSAVALHRIVRLPYGAPSTTGETYRLVPHLSGVLTRHGAASVLQARQSAGSSIEAGAQPRESVLVKMISSKCEPTRQGMEQFQRLLRSELVRPGWLYIQYHRATEAYLSSNGLAGITRPDSDARPEECSYPLHLGKELLNTEDGDRWPFAQGLYRGDFDSALMERVTELVAGEALDELFNDMASFKVSSGAHPDEVSVELLAEIADDPETQIPLGMLSDFALDLDEADRQMQSHLWWPTRIAAPSTSIPSRMIRSLRIQDSVVHQAVRVDFSGPIPLTAITGITEPVRSRGGVDSCDEPNRDDESGPLI